LTLDDKSAMVLRNVGRHQPVSTAPVLNSCCVNEIGECQLGYTDTACPSPWQLHHHIQ